MKKIKIILASMLILALAATAVCADGNIFTISDVKGRPGDVVKVDVSLKTEDVINTIGLRDIKYDDSVLTFKGFTDYEEMEEKAILSSFDNKKGACVIGFETDGKYEGKICSLEFLISEDAQEETFSVGAVSGLKLGNAEVVSSVDEGSITVRRQMTGDLNLDECVDLNDAILLLQHSMFPQIYILEYAGSVDFTGDGVVDMNDAILLLQHSMFPDLYPLEEKKPDREDFFEGVTITPKNMASDVSEDTKIVFTFPEEVFDTDGEDLTASYIEDNIQLRKASASGTKIGFVATISSSKKIILNPYANLSDGQKYYIVIPEGVLTYKDGSENEKFTSCFTVGEGEDDDDDNEDEDEETFFGLTVSPSNGEINVSVSTDIRFLYEAAGKVYDKNGDALSSEYVEDTFLIRKGSKDGSEVFFNANVNVYRIELVPTSKLSEATKYYVIIPAGVLTDEKGNTNEEIVTYFMTTGYEYSEEDFLYGVSILPSYRQEDVPVLQNIVFEFPEKVYDMQDNELTAEYVEECFSLTQFGDPVEYTVTVEDGTKIIVDPVYPLEYDTSYNFKLSQNSLKNARGIVNNVYSSYFTTQTMNAFDNLVIPNTLTYTQDGVEYTENAPEYADGIWYVHAWLDKEEKYIPVVTEGIEPAVIDENGNLTAEYKDKLCVYSIDADGMYTLKPLGYDADGETGVGRDISVLDDKNDSTGMYYSEAAECTYVRISEERCELSAFDRFLCITDNTKIIIRTFDEDSLCYDYDVFSKALPEFGEGTVFENVSYVVRNNKEFTTRELVEVLYAETSSRAYGSEEFLGMTVSPANKKTNVAVTSNIVFSFDDEVFDDMCDEIDDDYVEDYFQIRKGSTSGTKVSFTATVSSSGTKITLNPVSNLAASTRYYVIILAGTLTDEDENENDKFTSYFTTASASDDEDEDNLFAGMTVSPAAGKEIFSLSANITISFDEAVYDDGEDKLTASYISSNIELRKDSATGTKVAFTASISSTNMKITINPTANLEKASKYYLIIPEGTFTNTDGSENDKYVMFFTTTGYERDDSEFFDGVEVDPADKEADVSLSSNIYFSFPESVFDEELETLTTAYIKENFEIRKGSETGTMVTFAASISSTKNRITLNPSNNFESAQIYYVIIPAGVLKYEDETQNQEFVMSFTTPGYVSDPVCSFCGKAHETAEHECSKCGGKGHETATWCETCKNHEHDTEDCPNTACPDCGEENCTDTTGKYCADCDEHGHEESDVHCEKCGDYGCTETKWCHMCREHDHEDGDHCEYCNEVNCTETTWCHMCHEHGHGDYDHCIYCGSIDHHAENCPYLDGDDSEGGNEGSGEGGNEGGNEVHVGGDELFCSYCEQVHSSSEHVCSVCGEQGHEISTWCDMCYSHDHNTEDCIYSAVASC